MEKPDRRTTIVIASCVGLFAVYIASIFYVSTLKLPEKTLYLVESIDYIIMPLLAALAAIVAWVRAEHNQKRFMMYLACATTFILLTEVAWQTQSYLIGGSEPPHANLSDVFSLSSYVFLALAIFSLATMKSIFKEVKTRSFVDVLIFTLFAGIAIWYFDVRHVFLEYAGQSVVDRLFMTIFPVIDLGLIFGVFLNAVGYKRSRWRIWELFVAFGVVFLTIADTMMAHLSADAAYLASNFNATLLDTAWLSAYFLFFMAAISYLLARDKTHYVVDEVREIKLNSRWRELLIYGAILGTMVFFILFAIANNDRSYDTWVIVGFGSILILLVVLRAVFYVNESNRIIASSLTDPLTGVYNYRFFQTRFDEELERAKRYNENLSVAILDLDSFGQINKVHGHSIGDAALKVFADALRDYSRLPDSVCRVGGDEFAVLLPQTKGVEAIKVYIRIKQKLETEAQKQPSLIIPTFSCGISTYPAHGLDKDEMQKNADIALHWAKFHGKDQVLVYEPGYMKRLTPTEESRQVDELAYLNTVQVLAATVDARSAYTLHHSRNVAGMGVELAGEMGLAADKVKLIETAALLHDVGKIGISDKVLNKEGALTEEERREMMGHPGLSEKILSSTNLREILPWIVAHHERWDGTGYPKGLKGEAIPLEGRVLALCDAYDAMTSDRPYRDALSPEQASEEIKKYSGTQFDPELAAIFLSMLDKSQATRAVDLF